MQYSIVSVAQGNYLSDVVDVGYTERVYALYKWAKATHGGWLLAAYAVWSVSIASLGLLFKLDHFSFGAAVVLATVIHLAIGVCWSLLMTDAKVTTLEIIGLIFAAIAVVLLELGRA